jgi:hypothetical protein
MWMHRLCKAKMVIARRSGLDDVAAVLSEVYTWLKKRLNRFGRCSVCGSICSPFADYPTNKVSGDRCRIHQRRRKKKLAIHE